VIRQWSQGAELALDNPLPVVSLPATVLLRMMGYLAVPELALLCKVSKHWNVLSEFDALWLALRRPASEHVRDMLSIKALGEGREGADIYVYTPKWHRREKDTVKGIHTFSKLEDEEGCYYLLGPDPPVTSGVRDGYCLPIVIDNGAMTTLAGFAGYRKPMVDMASLTAQSCMVTPATEPLMLQDSKGRVKLHSMARDCSRYPYLVGREVSELALRDLSHAFRFNSHVFADQPEYWEDLTDLWASVFEQLGVDSSAHPVLLTMPVLAPTSLGEKMLQIMFDVFDVPVCHIEQAPLLSIFSYGKPTGLVVDIGESSAQIAPIYEGHLLHHHMRRVKHISGRAATEQLMSNWAATDSDVVLGRTHHEAVTTARDIKHRMVFTPENYAKEIQEESKSCYPRFVKDNLGKDKELWLHEELLNCGEMFFNPSLILGDADASIKSIQQLCADVILACDVDTRDGLAKNILLSGAPANTVCSYCAVCVVIRHPCLCCLAHAARFW
jgi:actin-related protein